VHGHFEQWNIDMEDLQESSMDTQSVNQPSRKRKRTDFNKDHSCQQSESAAYRLKRKLEYCQPFEFHTDQTFRLADQN
jgi:hypothetical protein